MFRPPTRPPSRTLLRVAQVVAAAAAFLFAVQLLSEAMRALSPAVRPLLYRRAASDVQLVGISWLLAYVMLNGSAVAAIALSLFSAGLVDVTEVFLLVAGSRFGAAGIVLLIGGLDFLRTREYSLPEALRLGMLTFVVGLTIYVPATVIGVAVIQWIDRGVWPRSVDVAIPLGGVAVIDPLVTATIRLFGAVPSALLALLLFLGSLHLLDRLLERVETDWLRERVFVLLRRRWVSFGLGLAITAVATSIAFSMGVIVPIYNRGEIERDEIIPYIMGASLGTLTDTLIVAVILGSSMGVATVLLLSVAAAVSAGVALAFYESYYSIVDAVQERLIRNSWAFAAFLLSIVVVPVVLVVVAP